LGSPRDALELPGDPRGRPKGAQGIPKAPQSLPREVQDTPKAAPRAKHEENVILMPL